MTAIEPVTPVDAVDRRVEHTERASTASRRRREIDRDRPDRVVGTGQGDRHLPLLVPDSGSPGANCTPIVSTAGPVPDAGDTVIQGCVGVADHAALPEPVCESRTVCAGVC